MHDFLRLTKAVVTRYSQVLLVLLAFSLMVFSSYYFVRDTEISHLRKNAEDAISYTELNIKSDLLEPETLLGGISETIRSMIGYGESSETVNNYIKYINDYVEAGSGERLLGVIGFFGFFDVYGGVFLIGSDTWEPGDDYDLLSRPWYDGAINAAGGINITKPYFNVFSNESTITISRCIFDNDGNSLGIVCLNIELSRIKQYAVNTRFTKDGYGFLMSNDLDVIAHPEPSMLGLSLAKIKSGISVFYGTLRQGNNVSEAIAYDYRGIESIVFIQRLYNGWYMGVVTPKDNYFSSTVNLIFILSVLGIIFAVLLIWILLRISGEKTKSEERTKIMLDAAPICMIFWDEKLHLIDCNYEAVKMFGFYEKEKFIENFFKLSPLQQPDGVPSTEKGGKLVRKALEEGYSHFEWLHQKLNGEQIPTEVTCIRVKHRGVFTVTEYIRDLREQKAMIAEMRKAEIAEESNKAKSDFLAKMSHEIRTPMNAILGVAEIQLQDETHSRTTKEAFARIYNSGDLLLGIINDILDLSKIEAGKLVLAPVQYDIASLIYDTVQLNIIRFENKPIEFFLDINENIPLMLIGDELRIKQILNNLISNAFKYTQVGSVTLSVYTEPHSTEDDLKKKLVFVVSDTGQGMTAEQIDLLGTEYSRFNMEANRKTEGAGLGMNITQNLIRLMNGTIFIESTPGMGSTFTVTLPQEFAGTLVIGRELADNLMQLNFDSSIKIRNVHIKREYMPYGSVLIVDDVESNLYVARGLMASYGLTIDTVTSGFEAVDKIREGSSYDIIFMDHMMPRMDGIEATRLIRSLGYTKPVVVLTANAIEGQAEMFMKNGFDDFISKPIDMRQLNMVLNKLIRDKYPPDVVEAARKQKDIMQSNTHNGKSVDPQLGEYFLNDARRAIKALEALFLNKFRRNDDLSEFIINVHAMKSSLANIGETDISGEAAKLEQAGREQNTGLILSELPVFLEHLYVVVKKFETREKEEIQDNAGEDDNIPFLKEKLLAVKYACKLFDKKNAKETLAELKQRTWSHSVKDMFGVLSGLFLHSDFDEAVKFIDDYMEQL